MITLIFHKQIWYNLTISVLVKLHFVLSKIHFFIFWIEFSALFYERFGNMRPR